MAKDLSTEVLIQIREEMQGMRAELREVGTELRGVKQRVLDTEVRLATEIVAVAKAVNQVRDELRESRVLRGQVDDHEARIASLEKRAG